MTRIQAEVQTRPVNVEPAVRVRNVAKVFSTGRRSAPLLALRDVELDVAPGEFVSIIGPSGCGKSTLLRLIADIDQPTRGEIQVLGRTPREARQARSVGFAFQTPVMLPWRDTLSNVAFALEILGVPRPEREERARAAMARVGLTGFERVFPDQLSGGMRQRAAFARILTLQPQVLLMDEPFSALDELTRERIGMDLGAVIEDTRTTALMVTHNIEEAVFLSDRVVLFTPRPGTIAAEFPVDLPRPRTARLRKQREFVDLASEIRSMIHSG